MDAAPPIHDVELTLLIEANEALGKKERTMRHDWTLSALRELRARRAAGQLAALMDAPA